MRRTSLPRHSRAHRPAHARSQAPAVPRAIALLIASALTFVVACGGSSSNTTTAPTTTRCAVSLRTDAPTIDAVGGAGVLSITVNRECAWEARTDVPWLTLATAASGQGAGTVAFQVSANPAPQPRRGHLIVNGVQAEVMQTGAACTFSIEPTVGTIDAAGGAVAVQVRGLSGCPWTATSQAPWLRVAGGASGEGPGVVTLEVESNSGDPRTGTALVAGLPFTVAQGGAVVPPIGACSLAVTPSTVTIPAAGGPSTIAISGAAACPWTATTPQPWITFGSPSSGQGPATLTLVAAPNTSTTVRTGTVVVANRPILVVQEAALQTPPVVSCSYGLTPQTSTVPAGGGSAVLSMTTAASCPWTATSSTSWLVVVAGTSGTGPGAITVTAPANPGTTQRTATVNAGGQSVTVTQSAPGATPNPSTCTFEVAPAALSVDANATVGSVAVTASATTCAWSATSPVLWITSGATGGTGSGPFAFAIAANPETTARSATLTVAGRAVLVTQAGAVAPAPPCSFTVTPTTVSLPAAAGTGQVSVTTTASCSWTAMSNASWLAVTSGSSSTGPGTVSFQAAANPETTPRTATVTVAGQNVTVTQAAAAPTPCTYALNPTSANVAASGGTVATQIATTASCPWTASAQVPWVQVVGATSGTGPSALTLSVAANADPVARTGTVVIGGQTFTVAQDAAPPCTFGVSPATQSVGPEAGPASVTVTASASSCAWTATSNASWIAIVAGAQGMGSGVVSLQVAENASTQARTGTVTVGGQSAAIVQAGQSAPTVTLDGPMADTSGTCPTLTFKVRGTLVMTDATTIFAGSPCAVLRNGTQVTVDGVVQPGGTVLATRVGTPAP